MMDPKTAAVKGGKPTEDELRDRVMEAYERLAYGLGQWWEYRDGLYHRTDEDIILKRVSTVVEAAKPEGVQPSLSKVKSVAGLLRIKAAVGREAWDSDPDILVCKNGALRIPTGELRPHSPEHYVTSALPYSVDHKY